MLRAWLAGGPNVTWQASGLGSGYSSVVVGLGRIYTMGRRDADVIVTAFDEATHAVVWAQKIGTTSRTPCSTPTLDGERLYALDPDGDLVCLDATTGASVWQRSFVDDFGGVMMSGRGYGESPLVDADKLICTPGGPEAALVALDKRTGGVLWKAKLPEIGPAGREGAGFSSVVVTEAAGIRQYVQLVGRGIVGVDARDGRFLWGYNAIANQTANIPTPIVYNDLVFSANGYTSGSVLLKLVPDAAADPKRPEIKAETVYSLTAGQFQNHHGGVVRIGNYLYGGHGNNNGLPTCLELSTGRVVWKRRGAGTGSAAVVAADGMLYFRYQNGLVALIEATEHGYNLKGTFEIPGAGGDSWAHPVVANGRLYLREQESLWVHDLRAGATSSPTSEPDNAALIDHPATITLRKRGLAVERLARAPSNRTAANSEQATSSPRPPRAAEKGRRLYEFVTGSTVRTPAEPPLIVVLTDAHLTAEGTVADDLLSILKELPGPLVVSLAGTKVSDPGLDALRPLKNLAGLSLDLCSRVSDAGLKHLASLKQLRVLILAGTNVTHAGIEHLAGSPSLVALDLEVCDGITDAACAPLGTMRQLCALNLKKTGFEPNRISGSGLQQFEGLSKLEVLNLYGNAVSDDGLKHLQPFEKLRDLDLSLLAITDAGLPNLQTLTTLEHLELLYSEGFAGPMVTNNGIESLRSLTNLHTLNLTGARLNDMGLMRLSGLTKLTSLQVVRAGVSTDGVNALRAILPKCEIVR